ncbi:hypoxanthine-guanine phosphoribosyltransferase [Marinomonas balearica]|uniref:Hypoxanthine phosphoribosyltransferase n=1 Tax=Marinomonas balearica TaxID=491947 RepID=A0A4R6MEF4_9GAMM|nr:hypoxanthine-guanine phosphoribosyltransferase [Marinomonas balearica]TDO99625.1 hypoxanthine phosphoribosyltransferase [Marinomonas balearica]
MTIQKIEELNTILEEADCLINAEQLDSAIDKIANQITKDYGDKLPIVICVMNGGLIPTAALLEKLQFPLELDYVHATRYGMELEGQVELKWHSYPQSDFKDRHILVMDDIFDQGHTLKAIVEWFKENGAKTVSCATTVNKLHDRKVEMTPEYVGAEVEDRFLFGYGMDYKGYFRNLKGIYAVKGT